ncbi:MAG: NTP transferase domain-containing protein [Solirubrobacteraceae bacterium]
MDELSPVCILAGGKGTRLGVSDRPKPLVEVAGEPFLFHPLRLLRSHGARQVVLLVDHLGEQIAEAVGDGSAFGLEATVLFDAPGFTGTAGALRGALEHLGDEFLVLYGDTYLRIDYHAVQVARRASARLALMTVLRNAGRWGQSNADYGDGIVRRHDKHAPDAGMAWIDFGLGVLTPQALERAPDSDDLADVYRELAADGELAGFVATERFYEIGSPAALAETEAFLNASNAGA